MAYNSDGYIMIDFTEVDFRRTNQTIEGLYKRCVDVIGTNKFILVINANGRTPLPATCSFTNNQYVIDTCIYMFAISSNDNLFIRRNDVPASDIIDDSSISVDKTWSSNMIDTELDGKADASALADYQPKLTAGTNITIDENDVISTDVKSFNPISIEFHESDEITGRTLLHTIEIEEAGFYQIVGRVVNEGAASASAALACTIIVDNEIRWYNVVRGQSNLTGGNNKGAVVTFDIFDTFPANSTVYIYGEYSVSSTLISVFGQLVRYT